MARSMVPGKKLGAGMAGGLLLLLALVLLSNAWMVDDAYITFRTIDNLASGHGLTWNPGERVQVYTHPLWMFAIALLYLVTSELFFTVSLVSWVVSLLAVWLVGVGRPSYERRWIHLITAVWVMCGLAGSEGSRPTSLARMVSVTFIKMLPNASKKASGWPEGKCVARLAVSPK